MSVERFLYLKFTDDPETEYKFYLGPKDSFVFTPSRLPDEGATVIIQRYCREAGLVNDRMFSEVQEHRVEDAP